MSALTRFTAAEIAQDESFWPELVEAIGEDGSIAVKRFATGRNWSAGELWRWIWRDEGRVRQYQEAKRLKTELVVGEVIDIADASEDAKLRVDTRFRVAEKWWPEVYGKKERVEVGVVALVDAGLVGLAGELLARLAPKVIEAEVIEISGD